MLSINTDVILVANVAFAALSCPASIDIFLGSLGFASSFRNFIVLNLAILFARITLDWHRNDHGINDLSSVGMDALRS